MWNSCRTTHGFRFQKIGKWSWFSHSYVNGFLLFTSKNLGWVASTLGHLCKYIWTSGIGMVAWMGLCIRYQVSFKLDISMLGLGIDFYSTWKLSLPVNISWVLAIDIRLIDHKGLITYGTAYCISVNIFMPASFAPVLTGDTIWSRWILCK